MSDETYYLSGPMKGYVNKNFPAFEATAATLREAGFTIVSPHEIEVPQRVGMATVVDYLRADMRALLDCTDIILMQGWPQSRGCNIELAIARELHMGVHFFDPLTEEVIVMDRMLDR